jgi:arabinoxylan arabinofuranohydrolase
MLKRATSFEARAASETNGGDIEIRIDSLTGKRAGNYDVKGTGGWLTWTTESCNVSGATGVHDLYLKFTGGSGYLFNFDWWKFKTASTEIIYGDLDGSGSVDAIYFS